MDNQIMGEELLESAQPAEAIKDDGATEALSVLPEKFKDVNALLNAYNSLQSEFTKRCQKIKELEGKINAEKVNAPANEGEPQKSVQGITEKDKQEILKGYLKDVLSNGQNVILMGNDGVGVKAPKNKPKSIREAGILAKEIL